MFFLRAGCVLWCVVVRGFESSVRNNTCRTWGNRPQRGAWHELSMTRYAFCTLWSGVPQACAIQQKYKSIFCLSSNPFYIRQLPQGSIVWLRNDFGTVNLHHPVQVTNTEFAKSSTFRTTGVPVDSEFRVLVRGACLFFQAFALVCFVSAGRIFWSEPC